MPNGFAVTFNIEGEQQLSRRLRIAAERVKDWTPAYEETGVTLTGLFSKDVFDTQGGVIEESWSPLKKAYALRKQRMYGNKGILEATGRMRNSFKYGVRPDMVQIWNEAEYFKYHQSNKPRTSDLPRRVMMKLAELQRQIVVKIFQTHFRNSIK